MNISGLRDGYRANKTAMQIRMAKCHAELGETVLFVCATEDHAKRMKEVFRDYPLVTVEWWGERENCSVSPR